MVKSSKANELAPKQTIFAGNGFATAALATGGAGMVHQHAPIFACGTKIRLQSIEKTSEKKSFDKVNGMA
jgi:hypothetical protein